MEIKEKEKAFVSEFKAFALKGNVVDMAVGVVIGGAFGKIVTSLVNDVIMPCVGMLTAGMDFSELKMILRPETLNEAGEVVSAAVSLNYGNFIQTIVDFLIVSLSIFITLKILFKRRDEKAKKEAEEAAAKAASEPKPETELDVLHDIRDLLREKQEKKEEPEA